jgi:hypothetical protein
VPFDERQAAEIFAVQEHDVEHAVVEVRGCVESILQQLEPRDTMLIERDELAIDDGVLLGLFQRLGDQLVVVAIRQQGLGVRDQVGRLSIGGQDRGRKRHPLLAQRPHRQRDAQYVGALTGTSEQGFYILTQPPPSWLGR